MLFVTGVIMAVPSKFVPQLDHWVFDVLTSFAIDLVGAYGALCFFCAYRERTAEKPPLRVPKWLARLIAGEHVVTMMTETRGGSNAKAKRELSWRPMHASWRQGFAEVLAQAP